MAWGWDASAHVVAGLINPPGRAQQRGAEVNAQRRRRGAVLLGQDLRRRQGRGALSIAVLDYVDDDRSEQRPQVHAHARPTSRSRSAAATAACSTSARRSACAGSRACSTQPRARQADRRRDRARSCSSRGGRCAASAATYRALIATVAVLREAGILLGEPDAGLTYEILNVLRDTQLFAAAERLRRAARVRRGLPRASDRRRTTARECGRVEQLLATRRLRRAARRRQARALRQRVRAAAAVRARQRSRRRGRPASTARMRRFTYGEHGDPFGALDLGGDVALSNDGSADMNPSDKALRITGELGFTYSQPGVAGSGSPRRSPRTAARCSSARQLQATYGLLDGTFAR